MLYTLSLSAVIEPIYALPAQSDGDSVVGGNRLAKRDVKQVLSTTGCLSWGGEVKKGDTCPSICKREGITPGQLMSANDVLKNNCANVSKNVGRLVCKKAVTAKTKNLYSGTSCEVLGDRIVKGDDCISAMERNGMAIDNFIQENDVAQGTCGKKFGTNLIGARVCIHKVEPTGELYTGRCMVVGTTVIKGDTCETIRDRNSMSEDDFYKFGKTPYLPLNAAIKPLRNMSAMRFAFLDLVILGLMMVKDSNCGMVTARKLGVKFAVAIPAPRLRREMA